MPTLTKINSGNIKNLLTKGVNPKTIEILEGAKKTGSIFRNPADLEKIGITRDEIDKIIPEISFADPEPVQIIKTATIETDLKGLPEYSLLVRYQNKENFELFEDVYSIKFWDKTQITYDEKIASDDFILLVKAPNGEFAKILDDAGKERISIDVKKNLLNNTSLKVIPINAIATNPAKPLTPSKIKGRLLSNNPSRKLEKVQIVIEVTTNDIDYFPICYAVSEQNGYFFTSQTQFDDFKNLKKARAKIGLLGINSIDIRLNEKDLVTVAATSTRAATVVKIKTIPEKLILYIDEANPKEESESDCDCDCKETDFHEKKSLDEFSLYTVIRTTEPLIEAFEINDVDEVNLEDIIDDDPEIIKIVSGIKTTKSILSSFINKHGNITKTNVGSLINESKVHSLKLKIFQPPKIKKGRIDLDGTNGVDWDDKPTIYQATTIAHGHLLNFKQEWFNDGYTIGDLIYSLPLAPGQKKQIVVFDWDRKDSASNTQQLDYQESLYNSLSRDRDVNEVARATLKEHSEGESEAGTWGWGVGGGLGAIIPIEVPIGALVGAGGGAGGGSSSASQDSNRTTTAKSHQHINDKTVQSANSVRSQRSTVIQTVSQGERFQVSAEVIANYNHCHAMTIEYFEVLRHFEIRTRLADVQECLFIPLRVTPFNRKKTLRWRDILFRCLKKAFLRSGFDALERIDEEFESSTDNYYDKLGIPKDRYAEEELEYIEGELYLEFHLTRPKNSDTDEFVEENWNHFIPFIGNAFEFYTTFIKHEQGKDEAFAKYAGPRIAEAVFNEIRFFAVKNGQSISVRRLPIDATLLSDFKNKKRLNVSLRMSGPMASGIKREDIDYVKISLDGSTGRSEQLRRLENGDFLKIIVHSGSMRYRTKSLHEFLFKDSNIKNDLTLDGDDVRVFTPLSAKALKKPRLEDVEVSNSLLHHLNENIEYYHQCIWSKMNAQRRFMLLDGLIAPGKAKGRSIASVVENKLVGIVGNCLVMPVAPGFQLDPTLNDKIDLFEHYYENPKDPVHVALPTKGVYAEAVMGKCNSCEKKEESRFWRWEESPTPDSPTTINPFTLPTPQNVQPNNLQPKDFPAPIINLQNGPALPDPQGFGSLVSLLSNPNLFKDITGLTENQKNALAALQGAFGTAQFFGGKAADLTGKASELFSKNQAFEAKQNALEQIKKAKENGLITEKQAQDLTQEAFSSILGNSGSTISQSVDDIAKTEKKVKEGEITRQDGEDIKQLAKEKEKVRTETEKGTSTKDLEQLMEKASTTGTDVKKDEEGFEINTNLKLGTPLIIDVVLTPSLRAFGPVSGPSLNKSGKTKLSVKASSGAPVGSTLVWKIPTVEAGKYTITQRMRGKISEVEISGIQPGLTNIDIELINAGNVIASDKLAICIPQFVTIDEAGISSPTLFDDVLTVFNILHKKDTIVSIAKDVCDELLKTSNVRTIWRVGPFSDTVPAHVPIANVTTVTIHGEPPAAHSGLFGVTNLPAGPAIFNETIEIFPGTLDNPTTTDLNTDAVALLIDIEAQGMTPALEPLAEQVIGRLIGFTISHEVVHSLVGFNIPTGHNSPAIPGDMMNNGGDLNFLEATGFNNIVRISPVDPAHFIDRGIGSIAKLTAGNQAIMDLYFPVAP